MTSRRRRSAAAVAALLLAAASSFAAPGLVAQAAPRTEALRLIGSDGGVTVRVERHRGYAAVPLEALGRLGWEVSRTAEGGRAVRAPHRIELRERSPFFLWGEALLQLAQEPYRLGNELWVPLQLLVDFLPERLPDDYAFEPEPLTLRVRTPVATAPSAGAAPASSGPGEARPGRPEAPAASPVRVVVIDPGHGGPDPGTRGPAGTSEKDVALAIGLALARELERRPDVQVHLTRADDRRVPPWERGSWATSIKGDRPGVFLSIHANAGPDRSARGFETYFLSEARTEHERRVAALENAAYAVSEDGPVAGDPGLDFILKDLGNLDHQHWSAHLADLIQDALGPIHTGPDRGVKQAPLAAITTSLMPSVLLEVGFLSNPEEERLLGSRAFQEEAARVIAAALDTFFERYPPGAAEAAGAEAP